LHQDIADSELGRDGPQSRRIWGEKDLRQTTKEGGGLRNWHPGEAGARNG